VDDARDPGARLARLRTDAAAGDPPRGGAPLDQGRRLDHRRPPLFQRHGGAAAARARSGQEAPPSNEIFDQRNTAEEKEQVGLYRASLDALEQNEEATYLGSMADDVAVFTPGGTRNARGKADLRAYYHQMHAAIGQLDTTATDAWGVGPYAIVEYTIAGVQLGPLEGAPVQRDTAVRLHIVDVAEFRDRKIQRVWRYDNPAELFAQPRY
jgi:hypothetical protein